MNKQEIIDKYGSVRAAARAMGMAESTLRCRLDRSEMSGKNVGENVGEEVCEALSNQNRLSEAKQPKKDALTAICDAMGILPEEVAGGWLKNEEASIRVKRTQSFTAPELSPQFVELLDSARRTVLRPSECQSADSMLVVSLHDAHFGRLSFFREAGENYDPSITAAIYRQAVSDALTFFNPSRIRKIVFPIGSDAFQVDNLRSETTSGTRVDSVDTRIHKVFDLAVASVIAAIEDCLTIADVDVCWIPGNHDELISAMLAKVVKQYFRHDTRVNVDDSEISRKVIHWGTNLLMISHRFTKPQTAPLTLATEYPELWGSTKCREIHHGHWHTQKATTFSPYFEVSGVIVRCLPSLCSSDKWHHDNQFTKNIRAAESHLYSYDTGFLGSHLAKVRE